MMMVALPHPMQIHPTMHLILHLPMIETRAEKNVPESRKPFASALLTTTVMTIPSLLAIYTSIGSQQFRKHLETKFELLIITIVFYQRLISFDGQLSSISNITKFINKIRMTPKGKAQFIIHRIQTNISLREIKAIPKIRQILVENSCYLNEHRWSEHIWNTTHLGFMVGLNPQYYDVDQANMKINSDIHKKFPRTKIPPFRLVFSSPQIRTDHYHTATKHMLSKQRRQTVWT